MTETEAAEQGIEIVARVARSFYQSNRAAYSRLVIEEEDLVGHLYETVLFNKYVPLVAEKPDYYTKESFGKSLFIACRKAMLSHVKKHITSQKRGNILAPGAAVELNKEVSGTEDMLPEVSKNASNRLMGDIKRMADECEDPVTQRALVLLSREIYTSKTQLRKRLKLAPSRFEQVWKGIQSAFTDFGATDLTPSLYEPAS